MRRPPLFHPFSLSIFARRDNSARKALQDTKSRGLSASARRARNETKRRTARESLHSLARSLSLRAEQATVVARLARDLPIHVPLAPRAFVAPVPELRDTARTFYKVVGTRESAPRRRRDTRESGAAHGGVVGFARSLARASFSLPPLPSSVPSPPLHRSFRLVSLALSSALSRHPCITSLLFSLLSRHRTRLLLRGVTPVRI